MRGVVFRGAGRPLALEQVAEPEPLDDEVIIRVGRCGICGSDFHLTSGHGFSFPIGAVLGHEYAGEVVALGRAVTRLRIGDRIAGMPARGCGACEACRSGHVLGCRGMEAALGGFAEYTRVAEPCATLLPASLSMADGALIEPLAVSLRGIGLAGVKREDRVLVMGAGSVGLAAIHWVHRLGTARLVAAAKSSRRHDLAIEMGASGFVRLGDDAADAIRTALDGDPTVVIECVGEPGLLQQAIDLVAPGGTVLSLGFCVQPDAILPVVATRKEVRMQFSFGYRLADFEHCARAFDAGHVEPRRMISTIVSLEGLPELFEQSRRDKRDTKIHVDPALGPSG